MPKMWLPKEWENELEAWRIARINGTWTPRGGGVPKLSPSSAQTYIGEVRAMLARAAKEVVPNDMSLMLQRAKAIGASFNPAYPICVQQFFDYLSDKKWTPAAVAKQTKAILTTDTLPAINVARKSSPEHKTVARSVSQKAVPPRIKKEPKKLLSNPKVGWKNQVPEYAIPYIEEFLKLDRHQQWLKISRNMSDKGTPIEKRPTHAKLVYEAADGRKYRLNEGKVERTREMWEEAAYWARWCPEHGVPEEYGNTTQTEALMRNFQSNGGGRKTYSYYKSMTCAWETVITYLKSKNIPTGNKQPDNVKSQPPLTKIDQPSGLKKETTSKKELKPAKKTATGSIQWGKNHQVIQLEKDRIYTVSYNENKLYVSSRFENTTTMELQVFQVPSSITVLIQSESNIHEEELTEGRTLVIENQGAKTKCFSKQPGA